MKKVYVRFNIRLFCYFISILLLFSAAVILFQYNREKEFKTQTLNTVLSANNKVFYNFIKSEDDKVVNLDSIVKIIASKDMRVSILDLGGRVIYDNDVKNLSLMSNHSTRPEILSADKKGFGHDIRLSETTKTYYYYYAEKYNSFYVRSALPYDVDLITMLKSDKTFLYFMLTVTFFVVIIFYYISNTIGKVIFRLRNFAIQAENETIKDELIEFPNDELGEISNSIMLNYKRIKNTKDALSYEKEKMFLHLQHSREGLAIFSSNKKEIIANANFLKFANTIIDTRISSAEQVLSMPEFLGIEDYLNTKFQQSSVYKEIINKNGKILLVQCVIFKDRSFEISIIDITDQEKEKQLKKELTQNIAHELKTPVCSIQGYMETLINHPEIDESKKQFFIERSYVQTKRLSQLLQDISLLTKLDESASSFSTEKINIGVIVNNVLNDVSLQLEQKNIKAETSIPKDIIIYGNESLTYSIFRNLADNTIAYAGENIKIKISCYNQDDEMYYFTYYDTGIGVNDEHLPRLFERFYRVDKGRSRKAGGTGLGLAIVKNAVLTHGGTIQAKRHKKGGLEFLFTLKKSKRQDS